MSYYYEHTQQERDFDVFGEGYSCYVAGMTEEDNPFHVGTRGYYEWLLGWNAGRNEKLGL